MRTAFSTYVVSVNAVHIFWGPKEGGRKRQEAKGKGLIRQEGASRGGSGVKKRG